MERQDILRMAREAGWWTISRLLGVRLQRFAALVAAAEREAITSKLLSIGALEDGEFIMAIRARRNI